jgi:hypothetical protein
MEILSNPVLPYYLANHITSYLGGRPDAKCIKDLSILFKRDIHNEDDESLQDIYVQAKRFYDTVERTIKAFRAAMVVENQQAEVIYSKMREDGQEPFRAMNTPICCSPKKEGGVQVVVWEHGLAWWYFKYARPAFCIDYNKYTIRCSEPESLSIRWEDLREVEVPRPFDCDYYTRYTRRFEGSTCFSCDECLRKYEDDFNDYYKDLKWDGVDEHYKQVGNYCIECIIDNKEEGFEPLYN